MVWLDKPALLEAKRAIMAEQAPENDGEALSAEKMEQIERSKN